MAIVLYAGRELPSVGLHWLDSVGAAVSLAAGGYTYSVQVVQDTVTSTLTGVTVTANSNPTADTGSANDVATLTLSFAAGALSGLSEGPGVLKVIATSSGLDREGEWPVVVRT